MIEAIQHFITHFFCCYYPKIQAIFIPGVSVVTVIGICRQHILNFIRRK